MNYSKRNNINTNPLWFQNRNNGNNNTPSWMDFSERRQTPSYSTRNNYNTNPSYFSNINESNSSQPSWMLNGNNRNSPQGAGTMLPATTGEYGMRGGMNGGYMNEQNQNMSGNTWQGNPANNDSGIPQQEMSGWEKFSLGAKGAASLGQAWLAWQGLEETKKQNAFARDAANTDVKAQSALIADQIRAQERAQASRYGSGFNSTGDAAAQKRVNQMNLPSNATGGRLNIDWS